jgi:polar amino acid transport system permease protein
MQSARPSDRASIAGKPRRRAADALKFALLAALIVGWMVHSTEGLGYHWQWFRIQRCFFAVVDGRLVPGPLIQGLAVTFKITAVSMVLALVFGLTTALLRLSGSIVARLVARMYLELIRNTPLLVQLFFIYFVLSPVFDISAFTSAVLALSLFEGAYASEIFRAGIQSIHRNQWEAAFSLGLGTWGTYRLVILPQAVRRIMPPLTSQAISLVKDSALVSTIAIYDLTMQAQAIVAETYLVFETWFSVAAVYLVATLSLSITVAFMEKRLKIFS